MHTAAREQVEEIVMTMEMVRDRIFRGILEYDRQRRGRRMHINLTLPQMRLLDLLYHAGAMTNKQLAEAMHVSPASSSAMVDRLVEQRLLERTTPRHDRRTVLVRLSNTGKKELEARRSVLKEVFSNIVEHLGEECVDQWLGVCRRLRAVLTPEQDKERGL